MPQCPVGSVMYKIRPGDSLWSIAQSYNTTIEGIIATNPGIDPNNLYIGDDICLRPGFEYYPARSYSIPNVTSKIQTDLSNYIRMFWEQHVVWIRLTIISMVFGLPDVELVTKRLLRNPKDFESLLKPLYGDKIASRFSELFTSHLVIASELVKAAKNGDNSAVEDAEKRWYANADEIAAFLASINRNWSQKNWKEMLHEHLTLTKAEAVNMLTGKYAEGISVFEQIEKQALEMADVMTQGIIKQFPHKFS